MVARRVILILIPLLVFGGIAGWLWYDRKHPVTVEQPPATDGWGQGEYTESSDDEAAMDDAPVAPAPEDGTATRTPSPEVKPVADAAAENAVPEAPPTPEGLLAEAAAAVDDVPLWQRLLRLPSPLRTAVQVIDAIAHGEPPVVPLAGLRPSVPFSAAAGADGRLVVTPASVDRYQAIGQLLERADGRRLARLCRRAEPLLEQQCRALGYQDIGIRKLLTDACTTILSLPDFDFEPTLIRRAPGLYAYEDPGFAQLNGAQQLFVRLGWRNCRRLKVVCNDFADELGLYAR